MTGLGPVSFRAVVDEILIDIGLVNANRSIALMNLSADHSRPELVRNRGMAGRDLHLFMTPTSTAATLSPPMKRPSPGVAVTGAESALAQTATALAALPIGLAIFDPRRRLVLVNPRFAALLSLPPAPLVPGYGFDAMLGMMASHPDFAGPDGSAFVASLSVASPDIPRTVFRQRTDARVIEVVFDPMADGGCSILVSDITTQARAEDDVRCRAHLLDLVLLNVPHGICVYGPDRRVALFNSTYNIVMQGSLLRVGDTLAEVIRRRAQAGEYGEGDPDAVFAEQMAFDISRPQMRRRVRPNGTAIDIRTAPLPDGGHISVVTDISALVQAEAELRRRSEEMSTMLGNIHHGIMLWGPDRCLVASNPVAASLLDLPADLLAPGRDEREVIAVLSKLGHFKSAGAAAAAHKLLAVDRTVPFGREITTLSGRILHVQSNPAPGGGWISTFSDITKMRETESELRGAKELAEAANQAKSRFLATMSHELRTPLNAIIGYSGALAGENGEAVAKLVAEYSAQINAAGKQLLSLINIILDVARIENGRFEPDAEVVDIGSAIKTAARQADGAAQAGDVSVELRIPSDLPWIRGDERRIIQALSQLLSNAVKFTDAGGSVTVEAGLTPAGAQPAGDLFVLIADTGIGIRDTELERLFEPFTQLDGSLSRRYPGAGLGLFAARAIITAHGGQLELISRPGSGTTARIILPGTRILT